jgi:hypothetical protein
MNSADPFDVGHWKIPLAMKPMDRPCRDKTINDWIEEKGVHARPGGGSGYTVVDEAEAAWYRKHKGYSERI